MKRILLVDDSTTLLLNVADILRGADYAIDTAHSGEEALDKFAAGLVVDLVITDLNMPGISGIELVRRLRALPATRFTPILCLTTESGDDMRKQARAAGATGWITKPPSGARLLQTLALLLKR